MTNDRPNILWICTDQQRYDTIGCLGNSAIRTPNIDALAKRGVAFTRAYAQSPICTPSRASFLTGSYPSNVPVNINGNSHFPAGDRLITSRLAHEGYHTGLVGKLHLSAAHGRVEQRPDDGYGSFEWSHHPQPEDFWPTELHGYQRWLRDRGVSWSESYGPNEETFEKPGHFRTGIPAEHHQTTWCIEEAIRFISEPRKDPWLLSVNLFDPHPPIDPPPEYMARMEVDRMPRPAFRDGDLEVHGDLGPVDHQTDVPMAPDSYDSRSMVAAYYAQIELIDDQLGRLMSTLETLGQVEDTLVIFMSDHGEMLGDHGLFLKGCRFYEGAVRVPLVMSWPGRIVEGLESDALVELVDLVPTILDVMRLAMPDHVQGKSLLPILSGAADASKHRDVVRCEYHAALDLPHASHGSMIFDGRHKLSLYHGPGTAELYDLGTDPYEFDNLWRDPESQDVLHRLTRASFDATMRAVLPGQPRVGPY